MNGVVTKTSSKSTASAAVTVASTSPSQSYSAAVLSNSPSFFWRLGDTSGTAADASPNGVTGTYEPGPPRAYRDRSPARRRRASTGHWPGDGAEPGDPARRRSRWSAGSDQHQRGRQADGLRRQPDRSSSADYDRHIYMMNDGQLVFGVYNSGVVDHRDTRRLQRWRSGTTSWRPRFRGRLQQYGAVRRRPADRHQHQQRPPGVHRLLAGRWRQPQVAGTSTPGAATARARPSRTATTSTAPSPMSRCTRRPCPRPRSPRTTPRGSTRREGTDRRSDEPARGSMANLGRECVMAGDSEVAPVRLGPPTRQRRLARGRGHGGGTRSPWRLGPSRSRLARSAPVPGTRCREAGGTRPGRLAGAGQRRPVRGVCPATGYAGPDAEQAAVVALERASAGTSPSTAVVPFSGPMPGQLSAGTWGGHHPDDQLGGGPRGRVVAGDDDRDQGRARQLKALHAPVLLRWFAEMDVSQPQLTPARLRLCRPPGGGSTGSSPVPGRPTCAGSGPQLVRLRPETAQRYYPGNAYVDWVGADGYNWAPELPGTSWRPFGQIFEPSTLGRVGGQADDICEFGTVVGAPGAKAAWFTQADPAFARSPRDPCRRLFRRRPPEFGRSSTGG